MLDQPAAVRSLFLASNLSRYVAIVDTGSGKVTSGLVAVPVQAADLSAKVSRTMRKTLKAWDIALAAAVFMLAENYLQRKQGIPSARDLARK